MLIKKYRFILLMYFSIFSCLVSSASSADTRVFEMVRHTADRYEAVPIANGTFRGSKEIRRFNGRVFGGSSQADDAGYFDPISKQLVVCESSRSESCRSTILQDAEAVMPAEGKASGSAAGFFVFRSNGKIEECSFASNRSLHCSSASVGSGKNNGKIERANGISRLHASFDGIEVGCTRSLFGQATNCTSARGPTKSDRALIFADFLGVGRIEALELRNGVAYLCTATPAGMQCMPTRGLDLILSNKGGKIATVSNGIGTTEIVSINANSVITCRIANSSLLQFSCQAETSSVNLKDAKVRVIQSRIKGSNQLGPEFLTIIPNSKSISVVSAIGGERKRKVLVEEMERSTAALGSALKRSRSSVRQQIAELRQGTEHGVAVPVSLSMDDDWGGSSLDGLYVPIWIGIDDNGDGVPNRDLWSDAIDWWYMDWWGNNNRANDEAARRLREQQCQGEYDAEMSFCDRGETLAFAAGAMGGGVFVIMVGLPSGGAGTLATLGLIGASGRGLAEAWAIGCKAYAYSVWAQCMSR
jgi:hypothetical protein